MGVILRIGKHHGRYIAHRMVNWDLYQIQVSHFGQQTSYDGHSGPFDGIGKPP